MDVGSSVTDWPPTCQLATSSQDVSAEPVQVKTHAERTALTVTTPVPPSTSNENVCVAVFGMAVARLTPKDTEVMVNTAVGSLYASVE